MKNENSQLLEKISAHSEPSSESKSEDQSRIQDLGSKVEELTKELEESNKLMIRLKLEHKNKLKAANKSLEKLKQVWLILYVFKKFYCFFQGSEDKAELLKLSNTVDELKADKENLQAKITELEEEKGNLLLSLLDYDELQGSYPIFPQLGSLKLVEDSLCEKVFYSTLLLNCLNTLPRFAARAHKFV